MGRLRVTPKGKVKKNIAITRAGRRKYVKARTATTRQIERAGHTNEFTQKYMKNRTTASQAYTRLGINIDASATKAQIADRKKRVKPHLKEKLEEPEGQRGTVGQPVSEFEGTMLCNLIEKHGDDFKRMSLDAKLNPMQLNPRQLQRRVVNYLKWERAAFEDEYAKAEADGIEMDDMSDPRLRRRRLAVKLQIDEEPNKTA
uniref:Nucleolar protein 16 n=1 Tax=Neobodo designis TaxID=312471 RepID=A0A7S1MJN8_NEODS